MPTGWNKVDDEFAETFKELREGDKVETDWVNSLSVIKTRKNQNTIGDYENQDVWSVDFKGRRGGKYRALLWGDAKVVSSTTGEQRDWDYAVLTKRFAKSRNRWVNNSDSLTELEVVGRLHEYRVSVIGYAGTRIPKNEASDMASVQSQARQKIRAGSFDLVWDANPEYDVEEVSDNEWKVSVVGWYAETVLAEDEEEAKKQVSWNGGRDLHYAEIDEVEKMS